MTRPRHRSSRPARPVAATPLGLMWKTVSEDCNLACDYCYYSGSGGMSHSRRNRVDRALLEESIRRTMAQANGRASFAWQGGEPLLAGLDFFEEVVALQLRYAPPGTIVGNALQTNATLLNDDWGRFLRKYNFLVGVSIDGPREIHDLRRVTASGHGSFDLTVRKLEHLRRHDVDFNILTVLHQGNVGRPRELMALYESQGIEFVQFIPGMDFRAQSPGVPARFLITADQYGSFLCETFDLWYNDGDPRMSVGFFDSVLCALTGREPPTCVHRRTCPPTLVLEHNGDAYPCDFYIDTRWRLGNIGADPLAGILGHGAYREFQRLKESLPPQCRHCDHLNLCHGGCPRNRVRADGTAGTDYFCSAYRQVFDYTRGRLTQLAQRLRARWIEDHLRSGRPWPERNEACICGSGRKFKVCCGPLREQPATTR